MNEWNIQSRAHACTACESPFIDKQTYHTVLLDDHAEFRRHDLCDACWQRDFGPAARDRQGFISYWHGIYEPPPVASEIIQKENAETLLRKLIEQNDPAHAPAAYILAVMLERKRLLKIKEQIRRDGQRIFIYEQPKTGDIFTIADPDLQLNQLEAVQRDVAHLLEHGFAPVEAIAVDLPSPVDAGPTDDVKPA